MTKEAAKKCFSKTGLTPEDVDVIELHDCFSVNELITYEALGLCPEGIPSILELLNSLVIASTQLSAVFPLFNSSKFISEGKMIARKFSLSDAFLPSRR